MADISKINVNSTVYNLKDSRLPNLNNSTTQYLRGDGTWAAPSVQTMSGNVDVTDKGSYMLIEPGSGGGGGGTYQAKTNIDPTTSSQTITADSGYDALSSVQINAMPSGTAGTPTATKGTVSNHSVSITPSVTNTTGYITGSTLTGTAVTVDVSELESGTLSITENGTGISVSGYSEVDVEVSSGDSWETLADQNVTIVSSSPNYFVITSYTTPFGADETYRITWGQGGTKYICQTILDETGGSYDGYVIGNPGVVGRTPDTGEPFLIYRDRADRLACATNASAGTLHITIEQQTSGAKYQSKTGVVPTTSSQTVFPDSGYDALSSVQINAMPSGTAGTPTATKGTVSNHSISVTPSVTNTTGYITGSTKTGTAVTVSASELVSGSETKTSNGTYDVTNLASLVVNVPAGKNAQMQSMSKRTSSNTYTDMGFEITVAKAGKYDIYWTGYRSSTGGTNGAQIYKNDTAVGNPQTTFDGTYANCQNGHVSNVSCDVDDVITIRARARSSSYYMYIMNLVIIEA